MQHQNKTTVELGPWVRGLSYLQNDDLDEGKQFISPNHVHLHKRTFLHLPKVNQTHRNSVQNSKHLLKVSHQSLDLDSETVSFGCTKSRYGALNGSLRKTKPPPIGISLELHRENNQRKQITSMVRRMSTVRIGEPVVVNSPQKPKKRVMVNEECAKKRGLMHFIKEVVQKKDFMQFYLQHRGERAYSNRQQL